MFKKQVNRSHYSFSQYYTKKRWSSLWHQIDEVLKFSPKSVLEVGGGLGVFKSAMNCFGVPVTIADIAEDLKPDILGSVTELPIGDNSFDVSCAFQVLEHLPFELFSQSLSELKRVARKAIVISLPDAKPVYPISIQIPKVGKLEFAIPKPMVNYKKKPLSFEHKWEVSRPDYPVKKVMKAFQMLGLNNLVTYRVTSNYYHRFFVVKLES